MQYELLRNANVNVTASFDAKGHPLASIQINDKYEHQFPPQSRVSKHLGLMSEQELALRLTGGQYFVADNELVDFRDNNYNGFVHTDDAIDSLISVVGMERHGADRVSLHPNTIGNINLGSQWSDHQISVPRYAEGGKYNSQLHFGWNPFVKNVHSAFMLYRLLCSNGMMGMKSLLNSKIPLVNHWEEHLEIANLQIQTKVHNIVSNRFAIMGDERATLAETIILANHAQKRLKSMNDNNTDMLHNILNIASPEMHLQNVYKDDAFTNMHIANQLPAHLTTYDVYNMATEIRTHSVATESSTTTALDKLANSLVFDRQITDKTSIDNSTAPKLNVFSDPDQAFFGQLAA